MSLSLVLVICTTAFFFLIIELYIVRNKKNISIMSGMMTAMTKGMLLGLLACRLN